VEGAIVMLRTPSALNAPAHPPLLTEEVETERQRWRESLLNGVFWSSAIAGAVIATVLFVQNVPHRSIGAVIVSLVAVACIFSGQWIHFRVRAVVLMSAVYGACSVGLSIDGFAPESLLGLAFLIALGTLLLGRATGIAATGIAIATLFTLSYLHANGTLHRPPEWWHLFDTANMETAARVTLIFATVCVALVFGISHLLTRTETLLREKDESLRRLEKAKSESERIQKQLDQHEREFRRAREMEVLARLASFAAHDFNNTLYVISGNTEIARRALDRRGDLESALGAIEAATRDASTTSRQLLSIGANGSKRSVSVHPKAEAERAGLLFQRILSNQIAVRVEAEPCPTIRAEEGAIQRILLNLALNARDAMPDGGSLSIRVHDADPHALPEALARTGDHYVEIQVEDTGRGMDDATVKQLFEMNFTTKGPLGNGLGLASAQNLARDAGGMITVESQLDRGTRFTIYWPAESYAARSRADTSPLEQAATSDA